MMIVICDCHIVIVKATDVNKGTNKLVCFSAQTFFPPSLIFGVSPEPI